MLTVYIPVMQGLTRSIAAIEVRTAHAYNVGGEPSRHIFINGQHYAEDQLFRSEAAAHADWCKQYVPQEDRFTVQEIIDSLDPDTPDNAAKTFQEVNATSEKILQFPVDPRESISRSYAEQTAREAVYLGDAREVSLATFAARVAYQQSLTQPTPNAEGVRVGDLFYGAWGWEQTNVDFFQVVALRGKHTAVIRKVAGDYVGGYSWSGNVRPCRGEFIGEEFIVRTKLCDYYDPPRVQMNHPTAKGHSLTPTTDDREHSYSSYA